jgi:hypothetical protein
MRLHRGAAREFEMRTKFLAPKHAAAELGLSTSRLVQLEEKGELRAIRDSNGRRFYDPNVIARLVRKRETQRLERRQQQVNAARHSSTGRSHAA